MSTLQVFNIIAPNSNTGTTNIVLGANGDVTFANTFSFSPNGQFVYSNTATPMTVGTLIVTGNTNANIVNSSVLTSSLLSTTNVTTTFLTASGNSSLRINPRVNSSASFANVSIDPSLFDQYNLTALAANITFNASTTGNPVNGQKMIIRIKDNGTSRTITWVGSGAGSFRAVGVTLPTSTTISKIVYIGCIYNSDESFWDVVSVAQQQ